MDARIANPATNQVSVGQPIATYGIFACTSGDSGNIDKIITPIIPVKKNTSPAANASASVLSCRQALLNVRILQAKKNPAVTGNS